MRTVLSVMGVLIAASAAFGAGEKPKAKPQSPAMMMPPPAVLAGKVTVMTNTVTKKCSVESWFFQEVTVDD